MLELIKTSNLRLSHTETQFVRYLFDDIEWEDRLIGISGARGTGKTTLMMQYLKTGLSKAQKGIYLSLDNLYFTRNSLLDVAEEFHINGGTHLFLDEVHKYPNWSLELKNLYDNYPKMHLVFSGSSAVQLQKADGDLSRRAAIYDLNELSFRVYLELNKIVKTPPIDLKELLQNHEKIAQEIAGQLSILPHFHHYLKTGVYPFVKEAKGQFYSRLNNVINLVLESDLPYVENINFQTIYKLKKLLLLIADSVPFKINTAELSRKSGLSRDVLLKMLQVLDRANLLALFHQEGAPTGHLTKPDKLYLNNSVLYYALHSTMYPPEGTVREIFFANQLGVRHTVNSSAHGDFMVDHKFVFEIGGKNKNDDQIKGLKNAFLALDNIEYGYRNKIPLWMFGLLY